MPEPLLPAWAIEMVKYVGFPALIFLVWYLTHKSHQLQLTKIVETQTAERENHMKILREERSMVLSLFADQMKSGEREAKDLAAAIQMNTSTLMKLESAIDANTKSIDHLLTRLP